MQAGQIKAEIARIIPHQIHCKTLKPGPEKGECNCNHSQLVEEMDTLFYQIRKGIK